MGHSRITLATLLALGLLGTVQAEEGRENPSLSNSRDRMAHRPRGATRAPAQPVAPVTLPRAQPIVRQVPAASAGSYGPVRPTDTLWSLASKHRPSNRVSVYQTMVAIYDKNPEASQTATSTIFWWVPTSCCPPPQRRGASQMPKHAVASTATTRAGRAEPQIPGQQAIPRRPAGGEQACSGQAGCGGQEYTAQGGADPGGTQGDGSSPEVKETAKAAVSTPWW